jgi:uncharacterized protein (TIGR02145 family)
VLGCPKGVPIYLAHDFMIKRFTFLLTQSLLFVVLQAYSQTISITPDTVLSICQGGSVTMAAHITGGGYGTNSYSFEVVPFHTEPIGDTAVDPDFGGNHDDAFSGPYPIGFQFCFLNQIYTQYWVCTNGWISFSQPLSSWTNYTPDTLPNNASNTPKNVIFGPWQDWFPGHIPPDVSGQNNVFRNIEPDSVDSKLVVSWNNCPMYGCYGSGGPMGGLAPEGTFQIVLHQQNSIIENNITRKDSCSWQNNSATQGIQNATGTVAYIAFHRNQNSWKTYNESTRFVPSGVTWYKDSYPGGTMVGYGDTIVVSPTVTTTYFAVVNTCINGTAIASKAVMVFQRPIPTITGATSACMNNTEKYITQAGMVEYTWTITNGTVVAGGNASADSVMVKWDQPSPPYSVSVTCTDTNGCSPAVPTIIDVTVHPFITPVITGVNSVCAGAQATFTVQGGNTNYLWTYPGATLISGGTTNDSTVTLSWSTANTYNISVNYTGPGGCTSNPPSTKSIVVNLIPVPSYTGPAIACIGSTQTYSTDAGMTGYSWTISSGGTINSGQGSNTISVTWNSLGIQSATVNYISNKGCSTNNPPSYTVTVIPLPVPTITGNNSICKGSTGNIFSTETGMTGYSWTVTPDGTITSGSGTNSIQVTWTTIGTKTVSVNYVNPGGCTAASPAIYTVIVNDLPSPTITGNNNLCTGTTGVVYSTQASMSNYSWAVVAGGTITSGGTPTDSTVTVTWNTAGAHAVSVNYYNANNCTATAPLSYPIIVHPLPVPTIAGPAAVCIGIPGAVYTSQPGMTNYQWVVSAGGTITAGGSSTDNSVTVTWNTAGVHSVSINYHDANSCTAVSSFVYNVTINPLPVPTITGSGVVCAGTSGLVYNTQTGMSNYIWTVSAGGTITSGGSATDQTVTVTWDTPGAQSVSINYHDANGCTAISASNFPITVNPLPVPTIAGNNNLCAGTTGVIYSTQPSMSNYSWAVSAGGTITSGGTTTDNTVTVTWNVAGAQTVSVNYNDANNCTATTPVSYPITVHSLPVPTIGGPTAVCAGISGSVYSTQPGMTNYQWVVSAGGTMTAGGTATDNSVTVTWNTVGAQTIAVNYHNANSCTAVAPFVYNITVDPLPVPAIAGPASVCLNSTTTYSTVAGMTNYLWTVSAGGSITSGAGTNSINALWTATGSNTITLNYHDANGCTAVTATSYSITVNPLPVPALIGLNQICVGHSTTYTTDAGMSNYSWNISAGGTITSGGGANDNTATILWNNTGPQSISVNYVMGTGCTAPSPTMVNVTVNPLPVPVVSGINVLCSGTTGVVYSTQPGMTNYQWTVSSGGTITSGGTLSDHTVTVTWNTAGAQSISVDYQDANSCTALLPVIYPVTIYPLPVPAILGPGSVCLNSSSVYFTDAGMTNYSWTVSAGGTITTGSGTSSITILWNTTGPKTITVNYFNGNNCTATTPSSYSVNVSTLPVPSLNGSNTVCKGNPIIYSTDAGMTSYVWTISAGGTLTAGGSSTDNTATITWNTAGVQSVSVNYQVGPGCTAALPTVLSITVKPLPAITNATNSSVCSATTLNITPQADLPGTTFSWTATGSSGNVTGFNPGSGVTIADYLVNTGFNIETVTYAVLPSLNGCQGSIANYIVTVDPVADIMFTPASQIFCSGGTTGIALNSHVTGATFTWSATGSSGNISGFGAGTGNIISQTLINTGYAIETATYFVLPTANSCPGITDTVIITVMPLPSVVYTPCTDITTTTDAIPFTLKGGMPLGGTYSGTGVNSGIFYPSLAGMGTSTIVYSYTSTYGCTSNASQNISVLGALGFTCDDLLTDVRDNTQYPTIKLGTQCWLAANLNFGNTIPSSSMQRDNCVVEKYCFNDNASNCSSLGGLYQWDEMMQFNDVEGIQGLCPPAWHIPTENDWTTLFNFYISSGFAGSPLKASGYSGFNALLLGIRFDDVKWDFNNFATFFWSSTSDGSTKAWAHAMNTSNPSVSYYPGNRSNAFSVRCIKN